MRSGAGGGGFGGELAGGLVGFGVWGLGGLGEGDWWCSWVGVGRRGEAWGDGGE